MRVLTPMLLRVGKESRSPISGPIFSLLSLQEGNNNTIAAAMMTAAMVIVCVNFFKCRNVLYLLSEWRKSPDVWLINGGGG